MRLRLIVGAAIVLSLSIAIPAALAAKPGNSPNAKLCQKGGWQTLYTRDGTPFGSETQCTSYGAQGGQIINEAALACLGGGWEDLGSSSTTPFTDEQECVDYAGDGGTPVAHGADVYVTLSDSANIECVTPWDPAYCFSQDVFVYNNGPAAATTVSVTFSDTEVPGAFGPNGALVNPNFCTEPSGSGTVTFSCTVTNVAAGGGAFLFRFYSYNGGSHTGSATITTSSPTDPDTSTTSNTVSWDRTAPTVPS